MQSLFYIKAKSKIIRKADLSTGSERETVDVEFTTQTLQCLCILLILGVSRCIENGLATVSLVKLEQKKKNERRMEQTEEFVEKHQ